jgi:transposase
MLLTDTIVDPYIALKIYRRKNIVEESFNRIKNFQECCSLLAHSQINLDIKLFITFISLVLTSHIDKIMNDMLLYKKYTMKECLQEVNLIKKYLLKIKHFYHQ